MDLRTARLGRGLTQAQAAARLGLSQPYLAMLERGRRRLTRDLARRAMRVYRLSPGLLPPLAPVAPGRSLDAPALARDLAALGYPGLAHFRPRRWTPKNPAEVLLAALAQEGLEARLVEALPWLLRRYWPLDRDWLVREAKLHDLQNRLGFVATLARRLAERGGDALKAQGLGELEAVLWHSRLAREDTLCRSSLTAAERRRLAARPSQDARRWNLLTDWTADALRYPA